MLRKIKTFLTWLLWNDWLCIDVLIGDTPCIECRLIREEEFDYIVEFSDPLSYGRPQRYRVSKNKALSKPYTRRVPTIIP